MGTDIAGWIECKRESLLVSDIWEAVMDISFVYSRRDYEAFGSLFGIRNNAKFQPIAMGRGLPENVSLQVKEAASYSEAFGHTWLTWQELKQIAWDEEPRLPIIRIHAYERLSGGSLKYIGLNEVNQSFMDNVGLQREWSEGQEWEFDGRVFRAERVTRGSTMVGWKPTFQVLEALASLYGDSNVRLVVWFD